MTICDLMAPFQLEANAGCVAGIVGPHRLVIRPLCCRENTDLFCECLQAWAFAGVSFRHLSHATLIELESRTTALLADFTVGLRHYLSEIFRRAVVVPGLECIVELARFGKVQRPFGQTTQCSRGSAIFETGKRSGHRSALNTASAHGK